MTQNKSLPWILEKTRERYRQDRAKYVNDETNRIIEDPEMGVSKSGYGALMDLRLLLMRRWPWILLVASIAVAGASLSIVVVNTSIQPGQGTVLGGAGVLGAAIVAFVGVERSRRTAENLALLEDGRERQNALSERYLATAIQLADSREFVRMAGIFALNELIGSWTKAGQHEQAQSCIKLLMGYLKTYAASEDKAVREAISEILFYNRHAHFQTPQWSFPLPLSGADLRYVRFSQLVLAKANFTKSNLSGADLSTTNLRGADFRGANLVGADFTRARVSGADFRDAIFDDTTVLVDLRWNEDEPPKWPNGLSVPEHKPDEPSLL